MSVRWVILLLLAAVMPALAQTQPAAGPAATRAASLLGVPNPVLQGRAREMIRGLFKNDYAKKSITDRQALGRLLVTQGQETRDDAVARYVAFTEALDLAANSGDAVTVMAAIAELAKGYTVDPMDLRRQNLLRAYVTAATPEDAEAVMRAAFDVAYQAAAVDAFDAVEQLTNLAEAAANKTRMVRVVASIQVPLSNLRDLIAEFALVKKAYVKLDTDAEHADAHLTIGRFYALDKGQWALGLPHLARCSDAKLKALAQDELAPPATDAAQLDIADRWWELAEASAGMTRENAAVHARQWYAAAQNRITGITLTRIQARINNGIPPTTLPGAAPVAASRAIELLPLIDPAKDVAQGKWAKAGARGELLCESGAYSVAEIPYTMPEEYDLAVTFTRTDGAGPVAVLLTAHGHAFDFAIDVKGEARFERVDAKIAKDNPTTVPVVIANGHRYVVTLEIRKDVIRALWDGRVLTEHKTDGKDLSRYNLWKVLDTALCGLGANNAGVVFHSVQVTEVTGKGKAIREK